MLCECLDSSELWRTARFPYTCKDFLGLTDSDLSSQLEYSSWRLIFGGERRGVEVNYCLILSLVKGIVDVE